MEYNTLGQLVKKETPDAGIVQYIYDNAGNLIYSQDANQASHTGNEWFTVYEYDDLGRLVRTGVEDDESFTWEGTSYPSVSNLDLYGTDEDEKIRNYYDIDYIEDGSNYCKGKLTKTIEKESGTETLYAYDKYGNIITKKINIPGMLDYKTIYHTYDNLGRETVIEYPSGTVVTKSYNRLGKLENIKVIE